jgi:hypothetical protein
MSADSDFPTPRGFDLGRALVGVLVGLAGLLLLAEPLVDPVSVGGQQVPMFLLSGIALAAGLDLGAVVFYRKGMRAAAMAHGVAGLGWSLVVVGPFLGSGVIWFLGLAVVIGGAVFLVVEVARRR